MTIDDTIVITREVEFHSLMKIKVFIFHCIFNEAIFISIDVPKSKYYFKEEIKSIQN